MENRDEISYWSGTGSEGEPRIVIDLDQQRAYFYVHHVPVPGVREKGFEPRLPIDSPTMSYSTVQPTVVLYPGGEG